MDVQTDNLHTRVRDDEIRLTDLVEELVRAKWLVVSIVAFFTAAAAVLALTSQKMYKAAIIVSPVTSTPGNGQMGGMSSLVPQFAGVASLAGISVGSDSKRAESVAVLQSEALTERYIRDNNLLPVLYEAKWDPQLKRWREHRPGRIPTVWKAEQFFKKNVRSVSTDTKTGLVTMTITWSDAKTAARWANDLVGLTNDYLRSKAIAESGRNIEYLNSEVLKTDVVGVKQAIYSILQNEISKEMLARGSDEYALKVIDPAIAPEVQSSPQRILWTAFGLFAGIVVSLSAVFVRIHRRRD
jgi:uncharacterized protein involved in exopolysaccharide biosynthesis